MHPIKLEHERQSAMSYGSIYFWTVTIAGVILIIFCYKQTFRNSTFVIIFNINLSIKY